MTHIKRGLIERANIKEALFHVFVNGKCIISSNDKEECRKIAYGAHRALAIAGIKFNSTHGYADECLDEDRYLFQIETEQ